MENYGITYEPPQLITEKGTFLPIHNDRGSMADRNPYRYARIGYRPRNAYKYALCGDKANRELMLLAKVRRIPVRGLLLIVAIILVAIAIICCIPTAKADSIGFPSYWEFDVELVKQIQNRLNYWNEAGLTIDGKFGPATAKAVKDFQSKEGLTASGVVDDETAEKLQATGWASGTTMYYMADLQAAYDHGKYEDIIYISLGGRARTSHFSLFRNGNLVAETACITGNEAEGNGTPCGTWTVVRKSRKRVVEEKGYSYYYILWLANKKGEATNYAIHSLLEYENGENDHQVLGAHQSEGCIRVPNELASWLYDNVVVGTVVVIDDRNYQPSSIGYETLISDDTYADWD